MGAGGPTVDQAERLVFSLLRRGDVVGALAQADAVVPERRTLKLAVVAAEARVCFGRGDLDELEDLRARAARSGDDLLALRVEAALADYHATRGSPLCGLIAARALADVGEQELVGAEELWARGRLWRTLALASLFVPGDRPARSLELIERAKADFRQAGFDAESARCAADLHFVWTLAFGEDVERTHDTLAECLARLRQQESSYQDLVLAYRVFVDMALGDFATTHTGADEIDAIARTRPLHPFARVIVSYVRVAIRLLGEGPTPAVLQAIEDHLTMVRSEALPVTTGQYVGLAAVLIDAGHTGPEHLLLARRWAAQAAAGEPSTPQTAQDLEALVTRLDLLERGDDAAVEAVDANLEEGRRLGLRRDAAQRGLRAALAARRAERHDVAERLYLEAILDLPPPDRRMLWENALVAAVVATRTTEPAGPRLRLLAQEVTVETRGPARPLSAALASLVVTLVAEGGAAPADRLVDALWPDADPEAGRARLRVALHRLRRTLDVGDGVDPVQRRGDLVALAPQVDVDVMRFEKLAAGSREERRAAIDLYGGDVAGVQLAYDDLAAPLRRRLSLMWREVAHGALADPGLSRARVLRIAAVAGHGAADDPELAGLLDAAERRLR